MTRWRRDTWRQESWFATVVEGFEASLPVGRLVSAGRQHVRHDRFGIPASDFRIDCERASQRIGWLCWLPRSSDRVFGRAG